MYYEDFGPDYHGETKGRTVTETDIVLFATMTGALNSAFLNEQFAKSTQFGGRIAPGFLTASIATGLIYQLPSSPFEGGFVALLNATLAAQKAVKIGDTLSCRVSVRKKMDKGTRGIVVLHTEVLNQSNEKVMEIDHVIMVNKR
jgi:acyl dehydratase